MISYKRFWVQATNYGRAPCALADGKCSGTKDAHHYVPKRRINLKLGKNSPAALAAKQDARNSVCLCRYHHEMVELGVLVCPEPPNLQAFVDAHGVPPRTALNLSRSQKSRPI